MASIQGFTDGSYDYKHMRRVHDLRGPLPYPTVNPNSILGFLKEHNQSFGGVIASVRRLAAQYNDIQATFTLLVPLNVPHVVRNMSELERRNLILAHTLERAVPYNFLTSAGVMWINTRIPGDRILVDNRTTESPLLNNHARVLGYDSVPGSRATIIYIDQMLPLQDNPLSNIDI